MFLFSFPRSLRGLPGYPLGRGDPGGGLAGTEPALIFSINNRVCLSTSAAPRAASAFMFNVRNLMQQFQLTGSLVISKRRTHKMSVPCSFNSWGKKGENLRKNNEKFNSRSRRSRQYSNVVLTCWVLGAVRQSYPDHRQQLEVSSLLAAGQQVLLPLIYLSLSSLPYSQVPTNALT